MRDAIAVMTGELAMNAVQHARTSYEITTELTGGTLRVEVTDSGPELPSSRADAATQQLTRPRAADRG
jgi:anti-sigma regulatory factor (Ser/Thr protein kinase)